MFPSDVAQRLEHTEWRRPFVATMTAGNERYSVQIATSENGRIQISSKRLHFSDANTHLQRLNCEFGDQLNDLGVTLDHHQLTQLVVRFEAGKQTTKFMIIIGITEPG